MIPLLDLRKQYNLIKPEIDACLQNILASGRFILGPEVTALEEELARFCGVTYAVGVASGSDALELSLQALGIKPGDEVITTPFTFIATAEAISQVGAKIVFADIRLDSYNIDAEKIKEKITSRTKAIIPVHLYGQPCRMEAIMKTAAENNLLVIEDCAQAAGAEYNGKITGSFGDVGCFSFFPSKNLGGYGDGGMVVTNDKQVAQKIKMLRVHGSDNKYFHSFPGRNSRLDEMQAGILRIKLKYLVQWNEQRQKKAAAYDRLFRENDLTIKVTIPEVMPQVKHVFNLYVVRAGQRDKLLEFLRSREIFADVHYPLALHQQEVYRDLGYQTGDFPQAELAAREVVSLPFYPEITDEQIELVVWTIKEFYRKGSI